MFSVGDYALYKRSGHAVQVIESKTLWGITTCKVYDASNNSVFSVSADELSENGDFAVSDDSFVRFVAAWCRVQNELANGIVFDISESVIPLPHQMYCLERAMATSEVRYMLADEVGLGKTIEAGLIIKELKTRGLIERVLVVCPKGLTTQWEAEMQDKFGERFVIITPDDYITLKRLKPETNPYDQFDNVIAPMDAIKPLEEHKGWSAEQVKQYNSERIEAVVSGSWDLIIIDEAHRVAGSTSDVARHKLGAVLAKSSPHLLLLTATPHSGKSEPFLRLMRMLDESAFPNANAVIREQVSPYLIRTEKREAVDNEGNRLFKNRRTQLMQVKWELRHDLQRQLYEAVTDYVRVGYNRAMQSKKTYIGFLMVLFQRMVTSGTDAIADALSRRIYALEYQNEHLQEVFSDEMQEAELEESLEDALHLMSEDISKEITELEHLRLLANNAKVECMDAKAEVLTDLLDRINRNDPDAKIIIFTEFCATQAALQQLCEFNGYSTTLINGRMSLDERNASITAFRREKRVLISTDAGGEGLNLQFAHIVINYDLPWNPMKIEQRIGRADRIGQKQDVEVYNFILDDTIENRVRFVLEEKLAVIFEELGIDKMQDVLNSESAGVDFTKVYMKTIAKPEYIKSYTDSIGRDLEKQVQQATDIQYLIKDNKTLKPDPELENRQNSFHAIMHSMLREYYAWKHMDTDLLTERLFHEDLNVNDTRIKGILATQQFWHPKEGAPAFHIDGLNTERGYWTLWEVTLGSDAEDKRMLSIFINENGIYRPAASKMIWDEVLRGQKRMTSFPSEKLDDATMAALMAKASEIAEDAFIDMRSDYQKRHDEEYRKRKYALTLRIEAARKIGIDNIRVSRIRKLEAQLEQATKNYEMKQTICPTFRPMLICCTR